jgi:methyl-accepting chemotaxis protein
MSTVNFQKRRALNLSVNRTLQLHMIRRIAMILLLSLLASSAVYYFFADREITTSYQLFHVHARNFLEFLLPVVIGAFVLSLVVGGVITLFFPHRIAGGLYGIEREVRRMADGDLTARIALRKKDAVHGLAVEVNRMVDGLHTRLQAVQIGLDEAHGGCASGAASEEIAQALAKAREGLRGLRLS